MFFLMDNRCERIRQTLFRDFNVCLNAFLTEKTVCRVLGEEDYLNMTVKGESEATEKEFFRLTSKPEARGEMEGVYLM